MASSSRPSANSLLIGLREEMKTSDEFVDLFVQRLEDEKALWGPRGEEKGEENKGEEKGQVKVRAKIPEAWAQKKIADASRLVSIAKKMNRNTRKALQLAESLTRQSPEAKHQGILEIYKCANDLYKMEKAGSKKERIIQIYILAARIARNPKSGKTQEKLKKLINRLYLKPHYNSTPWRNFLGMLAADLLAREKAAGIRPTSATLQFGRIGAASQEEAGADESKDELVAEGKGEAEDERKGERKAEPKAEEKREAKIAAKAKATALYHPLPFPNNDLNLVFEGGGVRGVAYLGPLEVFEQERMLPRAKRLVGSSVGSLPAMLVSIGCSLPQIREEVTSFEFKKFMDPIPGQEGVERLILESRMVDLIQVAMKTPKFGVLKGDVLLAWVRELVKQEFGDPDMTFQELHNEMVAHPGTGLKDLYLTASNITANRPEILSWETTPDMPIAFAVRISMAYPGVFEGVYYQLPGRDKPDLLVDGGLFLNYAVQIFDELRYIPKGYEAYFRQTGINPATIGLKIDTRDEMARIFWNITAFKSIAALEEKMAPQERVYRVPVADNAKEIYALKHLYKRSSLFNPVGGSALATHKMAEVEAWVRNMASHRTIQIYDCDTPTLKLDLEEKERAALWESGSKAAEAWLENYYKHATLAVLAPAKVEMLSSASFKNASVEELLFFIESNKQKLRELVHADSLVPGHLKGEIDKIDFLCYALEKQLLARVLAEIGALKDFPDSIFNKKPADLLDFEREMIIRVAFVHMFHSFCENENLSEIRRSFSFFPDFSRFPNPVTPANQISVEAIDLINSSEFLTLASPDVCDAYKRLVDRVNGLQKAAIVHEALERIIAERIAPEQGAVIAVEKSKLIQESQSEAARNLLNKHSP